MTSESQTLPFRISAEMYWSTFAGHTHRSIGRSFLCAPVSRHPAVKSFVHHPVYFLSGYL
jgi:hypothetical protein